MRQATINWCDSISELTWPFCDRTDNIIVDETMPYYSKNKLRLTPEADNLQALFAEAEILAGGGAAQQAQGQPKMLELIDSIMSIPSCLQVSKTNSLCHILFIYLDQDQQSKIEVVNKWIKEHKKYESLDRSEDGEAEGDNVKENKAVEKGDEDTDGDDNYKSIDTEPETDDSPAAGHLKRRKSSRNMLRSNRKSLRKLRELDSNTGSLKTINIYQSLEKQEITGSNSKQISYKELRHHQNFFLLHLFAFWR